MRLLIITQAVDRNDPVLGFFHAWIEEFASRVESVEVICLREGGHTFPDTVQVHSLGKTQAPKSFLKKLYFRVAYILRFYALLWKLRARYDVVFVHMNQEYVLLAGLLWKVLTKRVYMWRNHYAGSWLTDIAARFCTGIFCTSAYSYTAKYVKTIQMPVGVEVSEPANTIRTPKSILFLGRLAPAKRPEMLIDALGMLRTKGVFVTATFCGPGEREYTASLLQRATERGVAGSVTFIDAVPHSDVSRVFGVHEIFVNCSSAGMFDKTMLEAAAAGCMVLASSPDMRRAIGTEVFFENASELASRITETLDLSLEERAFRQSVLTRLVATHSLSALGERLTAILSEHQKPRVGFVLYPYGAPSAAGSPGAFAPFVEHLRSLYAEAMCIGYVKGSTYDATLHPNLRYVRLGRLPTWLFGRWAIDRSLETYLYMTPVIPLGMPAHRSVVVIHDFAYATLPLKTMRERIRRPFLRYIHRRSLEGAKAVIAVSQATKDECVRLFHIPPEKIHVVHNGYTLSSPKVVPGLPEQFFLFAGTLKERKNAAGVIRAFATFQNTTSYTHHLVLTGKPKGSYYTELVALATLLGVSTRVHFLGYVSNEELAFLYTKAEAMVFPSLCEGFGIPVVEAMASGCPVITSDRGALAEVAGEAALLVDPYDPPAIAEAMRRIVQEPETRETYVRLGRAQATHFSWERAAGEVVRVLRQI